MLTDRDLRIDAISVIRAPTDYSIDQRREIVVWILEINTPNETPSIAMGQKRFAQYPMTVRSEIMDSR